MHITVYYQSGVIDSFDTQTFCASEPFRRHGGNVLTEFRLRLDLLSTDGLVLEAFWYELPAGDAASGRDGLAPAPRHPSYKLLILGPEEVGGIAKIVCDGELLVWRQGDDLINGVKFSGQEVLCFSDHVTTSINERALALFNYLRRATPDDEKTDDEVAGMMGYTTAALEAVLRAEAANAAALDDEDGYDVDDEPAEEDDFGDCP